MKGLLSKKSSLLEEYNFKAEEKRLTMPHLNLKISNSKKTRGINKVLQSASKMAANQHDEQQLNKLDEIFDLSIEQITQRLEDIHETLFDANTFNLNYNISTYTPASHQADGYSYSSPAKSTAGSSQETKSLLNPVYNQTHEDNMDVLSDFDNVSMLSNNSFTSNISSLSQNSNYSQYPQQQQKVLNFRDPTPAMPTPAKYTKTCVPFGNPFKITIRPSNNLEFNDSDLVSEDDAFNTKVLEKKKASRLASFAAVYKNKVKKQISSYIQYHNESKADNMKKIDNYLQILVKKHAEERQRKTRRQNEISTGDLEIKMDENLGRKRDYGELNNFDLSDLGVDFGEIQTDQDADQLEEEQNDDFQVNNVLKADPFYAEESEFGFDVAENLFEDMFNLKELVFRKIEATVGSEWQRMLSQHLRYVRIKYRECYDLEQLNSLIDKFVKDHFEIVF